MKQFNIKLNLHSLEKFGYIDDREDWKFYLLEENDLQEASYLGNDP
jgi:hypothetical protein